MNCIIERSLKSFKSLKSLRLLRSLRYHISLVDKIFLNRIIISGMVSINIEDITQRCINNYIDNSLPSTTCEHEIMTMTDDTKSLIHQFVAGIQY